METKLKDYIQKNIAKGKLRPYIANTGISLKRFMAIYDGEINASSIEMQLISEAFEVDASELF
jgi:hypothetical protein